MNANLAASAAFTFLAEGDETVSMDASDPGCWSTGQIGNGVLIGCKYGVTPPVLASWLKVPSVTASMMFGLSKTVATAIYGARYWQVVSGDLLPNGIDLMIADHAFNAGDTTSALILQRLIRMPFTDIDGWCGPETAAAAAKFDSSVFIFRLSAYALQRVQAFVGTKTDGEIGPLTLAAIAQHDDKTFVLCAALADAQLENYRSDAGWARYSAGWTNRVWARLSAALKLIPGGKLE